MDARYVAVVLIGIGVLLLLISYYGGENEEAPAYVSVNCLVLDDTNNAPIPGASVLVSGAGSYSTNSNGSCSFTVAGGEYYTIWVFANGYESESLDISVPESGELNITARLRPRTT